MANAKRETKWVVVANQSEARVYAQEGPRGELVELNHIANPGGQKMDSQLVSDRPGRSFDIAGEGRHAMEPSTDPKEYEAIRFAKDLARDLDVARARNAFDKLVLVAAPEFLGLLRHELTPPAAKLVEREIDKNLLPVAANELREQLSALL